MTPPNVLIIAGPNGSGKSTLTSALPGAGISIPQAYINPDDIARRLREERPNATQTEVERDAFMEGRRLREDYREKRISFALETVFSHPSGLIDLQRLRDAGYSITLVVVTTKNPEINVLRVRERVKTGGHAVAEDKIRQRHGRFMALLPRIIETADSALVYDASDKIRLCYRRDRFPVEWDAPIYLQECLIKPLVERECSRFQLESQFATGTMIEHPDEAVGSYVGIIQVSAPYYVLQEVDPRGYLLHDVLLLHNVPQTGTNVRIYYRDGYGQIASPST